MRAHGIPCTDIDYVITDGTNNIRIVIEYTCPDEVVWNPLKYLAAIDARRRDASQGNRNDDITLEIANRLGCEAILVVAQSDVDRGPDSILWWRYIDQEEWHERKAGEFFSNLKDFALNRRL